ncbi:MAG: DUF4258 domain-containing protein [Nitriliruptorales bacterium]
MAEFAVGETYRPRRRRLDTPALADKMIRRSITRDEIDAVLSDNVIIEVYEHRDRVRYVLLGSVRGRPLHVVVAEDDIVGATVVLSVYQADEAHGWDPASGFRRRKEGPDGR